MEQFLSYYPLKQGLKPNSLWNGRYRASGFLSYYPLKQGLKQELILLRDNDNPIFILLSIKTRIETSICHGSSSGFLLIFILLSIKTRIETSEKKLNT